MTTQTQPLISVVIPCFNQGRFLGGALESVLSQDYPATEVTVIDDGSSDNTSRVARSWPDVRLIRNARQRGLSAARNLGTDASSGEYIVFLDADDRLLGGALQAGADQLGAHPECGFVFGSFGLIDEDGSPIPQGDWPPIIEHHHYRELLRLNYIAVTAAVMFRRVVVQRVGGFDTTESPAADYAIYLRIAREHPIRRHPARVAEYRRHPHSMSRDSARMLGSAARVLRRELPFVRNTPEMLHALRTGEMGCRHHYGTSLRDDMVGDLRAGRWIRALRSAATLLRYCPSIAIARPSRS
jgi:glycosyltransferase involved in cell wall biosynthesis